MGSSTRAQNSIVESAMTADSARAGLRSILLATVIAGIFGYAIQLLAPAFLAEDSAYVTFTVYWSTLYLCVATLSGIQQEITRAAAPVVDQPPSPVLRQFTLISIAVTLVVVVVLALLFGHLILPSSTLALAVALGIGVVGYLLVAVLSGVLYGLRMWTAVAGITILDAGFRALLVLTALAAGLGEEWITLAASVPFGLAFIVMWLRMRSRVVGRFRLDVPLRRLLAHTAGTVVAAASMGIIMNGLPMLLRLTSADAQPSVLAGIILAISITRAPIVLPLLALQSFFISVFRGQGAAITRRIFLYLGVGVVVIAVLAGVAWLIGPWAIGWLSAGRFEIEPAIMAAITTSAGLVALLCVTGPALLGERRHTPYVAGWVVTALLTIGALLLPIDLISRLSLALLVPPAVGLLVHLGALLRPPAVVISASVP